MASLAMMRDVSVTSLLVFALYSTIAYYICWIIYTRTLHPLAKVPGPWLASVSHIWLIRQFRGGRIEYTQRALHAKYGPLIRIAPNAVTCAQPETLKQIYSAQNPLEKTKFYPVWEVKKFSKYPDMFSNDNEKLHAERRKIVNHVYTLSNVLKSEDYVDLCSNLLMQRFGEYADRKEPCDLSKWLQMFAFDVVGELFFGQMFGFMQNREDYKSLIGSVDAALPTMVTLALIPPYARPFYMCTAILNSALRKALKAFDHILESASSCVEERAKQLKSDVEATPRQDMLQILFDTWKNKGEKVDFGMGEIKIEAYVAMFAGSDSTAIAMRSTLYHLMKNPSLYKKVQAEIDKAVETNEMSIPVKYTESTKLPLLSACIKEAMRIHPSVQLDMPRTSPKGGMTLCDTYIPAGYHVGMNPAVIQHDEGVFGKDPDVFRPERWLEGNVANMDKHMLQFGAGTRTCLGKNISLSMIHKMIPQLLRTFDVELVDSKATWKTNNFWFNKQTNINVYFKRRRLDQ